MTLIVHKLVLCETNGHDTQYSRGFSANLNPSLKNRFVEAVNGGANLNYQTVATVAPEIIAPVSVPEGVAKIPNGWEHPRYYFFMVVSRVKNNTLSATGGVIYEVISGYTTHKMDGMRVYTNGSHVLMDPTLGFYVNNITRASLISVVGPNGETYQSLSMQEVIQFSPNNYDAQQLRDWPNAQFPQYQTAGFGQIPTEQYTLQTGMAMPAPEMFYGPQHNTHLITPGYATRAACVGRQLGVDAGMPMDLQSGNHAIPLQHYRTDSDANSWLLRAIHAARFVDATMQDNTAYNQLNHVQEYNMPPGIEPSTDENAFTCFNELTRYTNYPVNGYLTYQELEMKFPNLSDVTDIIDLRGGGARQLVPADQGVTRDVAEPLCGSSLDVVTVVTLVGQLTSLLSRAGVMLATVHMSNLVPGDDGLPYRVTFLEYSHILSQITGLPGDFMQSINVLSDEIRRYLVPQLTVHNQISADCTVYYRLYRDTTVRMAYDGGTYRDYIIPQWCDGAISPTVTYDPTRNNCVGAALNTLTADLYAAEPKAF